MKRNEFKEKYSKEIYLGDGLYAYFDGYHIMLRAPRENGDHIIGLEPSVFDNLQLYVKTLYEDANTIDD